MCLLKMSDVTIFYMLSRANGWHTWTWIPEILRPKRNGRTWFLHSALLFCALLKGTPLSLCLQSSTGLGLGLSTAVLQILTRREHTICCLCLQHAIYRAVTRSPSLWTLIQPPVWVASLGVVDAFLIPTGLWGVLSSDILNLNLACCLPVLPSLHISACLHLRKKICSEKKPRLFSLAWSINQTKQGEMKWKWSVTSGEKPSFDLSWYCWLQRRGKHFTILSLLFGVWSNCFG